MPVTTLVHEGRSPLLRKFVSALNRKLIRDLWNIKGQALAIALVITAGAATFVMALTAPALITKM